MSKPHIQIIVGTTRPNRVGRKIADWYYEIANERDDMTFEIVDLAEVKLPLYDEAVSAAYVQTYDHDYTQKWSDTIKKADGYIFVTGEYNHGIPPALKNAIDHLYHEWARKPVTFVGYGGLGAARAVEQLVSVANELKMVSLRERTSIIDVWAAFDDDGSLKDQYIKGNSDTQLDELSWWATVLKDARQADTL